MVSISDFIVQCWLRTGGSWIDSFTFWRDHRTMTKYYLYHKVPVTNLPQRCRRLSISDPDYEKLPITAIAPECRLLNLPAEIRCLIWQHVFAGHLIAIYRKGKQITHCLVDDTNSLEVKDSYPVNVEVIEFLLKRRGESRKKLKRKKKSRPSTLHVVPLLQSCRTIYVESINLLYSHNTFLFLQNDTLPDFGKIVLSKRLDSIRSMHIHFQFREIGPWKARYGFNEDNLQYVTALLGVGQCKNVEHLSVFIQGPIWLGNTYESLLEQLRCIQLLRANSFKSFVVRLPKQMSDPIFGSHFGVDIDNMVANPSLPFQIIRPENAIGRLEDQDVGLDVGYRQGEVFLPRNKGDGPPGFDVRRYTVWTPMPPGLKWPCQQWRP